jgi:hypothetical protein
MRAPPPRITNLALLVALVVAFASGVGAVAAGTASGRWVAVLHGVVGVAVVLLVPWKSMIVRRGLRRARRSRWLSLLLAALAVTALVTGLGSASGVLRSVGAFRGIWLHVAAALALVPLVVWHVLARPAHAHRTDLSRRTLLRAGTLGVAAAGVYVAITAVVRAAGLPGASRRFTGSYEAGSRRPPARDPRLHQRLVRPPGLGGRAGRGAGPQHRRRPEPPRPLEHRLLDPVPDRRPRPAVARHPRRWRPALGRARLPGPPGRSRPPRLLVGQVGRPHRAAVDPVVVAATIPGHLREAAGVDSASDQLSAL